MKLVMKIASLEASLRLPDTADLHVTRQQGLHVTVTLYHWGSSESPRSRLGCRLTLRWEEAGTERVRWWWDSKGALGSLFVPCWVTHRHSPCPEDIGWVQGNLSSQDNSPARLFAGSGAGFVHGF